MIFREFQGLKLSMLGMGCMRLPVVDGKADLIDEPAVADMTAYAMEHGVNYFDTAWGYHGGNSELVMGKCLKRYPRDSFFLADKFPGYDLSNMPKVEEIFERQLEKCGVDYFDFYLFHNICELNLEAYLDDKKYGIISYLKKQKETGRIRHLGFSVHSELEGMQRFLDACGDCLEFGQIQVNWLDWSFQDAKAKAELLQSRGIPIWAMEPLRGGQLASLEPEREAKLRQLRPQETPPGWAVRFLQAIEGMTVILSGASSLEQMKDNVRIFEKDDPVTVAERDALFSIAADMLRGTPPCTACRYCIDHCPQGLDIPALLELYSEHSFTGGGFLAPMALDAMPKEKHPDACTACRSCEAVCPQQIEISTALADFVERLKA